MTSSLIRVSGFLRPRQSRIRREVEIETLLSNLQSLPPWWLYLAVGALGAIENVFPPFPSDLGIAFAALLAGRGGLVTWGVLGSAWTGNVLAAWVVYLAARRYGRGAFRNRWGRRLISETSLTDIERAYHRHRRWGVFLLRLLPVWRGLVPPSAGIAGLPPLGTLVSIAAASAVWYAILVVGVAALGTSLDAIRAALARVNLVLGILAFVVLVGVGLWVWKIARRQPLG